jgi:surface protein
MILFVILSGILSGMFIGCQAVFKPVDYSSLKSAVNSCFSVRDGSGCSSSYGPIGTWDVSLITDMHSLFRDKTGFNQDISRWDVSQVADMSQMFRNNYRFNQDISGWVTSSVTNMKGMFQGAQDFDQNLGNWDHSKVLSLEYAYENGNSH